MVGACRGSVSIGTEGTKAKEEEGEPNMIRSTPGKELSDAKRSPRPVTRSTKASSAIIRIKKAVSTTGYADPRAEKERPTVVRAFKVIGSRDYPLNQRELLRSIRDRVVPQLSQVVPEVVLQAVFHVWVVRDAGREAGGEGGKRAGRVGEEDFECGVAVEDAGENESRDGLSCDGNTTGFHEPESPKGERNRCGEQRTMVVSKGKPRPSASA